MGRNKSYKESDRSVIEFLARNPFFAYILAFSLLLILLGSYICHSIQDYESQRDYYTEILQTEARNFERYISLYSPILIVNADGQYTLRGVDGSDINYETLLHDIVNDHLPPHIKMHITIDNTQVYPDDRTDNEILQSNPVVAKSFIINDQNWFLTIAPVEGMTPFTLNNLIRHLIALILFIIITWLVVKLIGYNAGLRRDREKLKEEKHSYFSLAENSPDLMLFFDRDLKLSYVNPVIKKYIGIEPGKIIGKSMQEIKSSFPKYKQELDKWQKEIETTIKLGSNKSLTYTINIGTEQLFFDVILAPGYGVDNGLRGTKRVNIVLKDVSPFRKAESELKKRLQITDSLFESIPEIAIIGYDKDRRVISWNDAASKMYGYEREEALSSKIDDLIISPENREQFLYTLKQMLGKEDYPESLEIQRKDRDGKLIDVLTNNLRIDVIDGEPVFYAADISVTKYIRLTEEIETERTLLATIFDNIQEIVYVADIETGDLLFVNQFVKDKTTEMSTQVNNCYDALRNQKDPCATIYQDKNLLVQDGPQKWEHYDPETDCYYLITARMIDWKDNKKAKLAMITDISEFKIIEKSLKIEKDKLYLTMESIGEGLISTDTEGKITLINKAAEKLTGWKEEEALGTNIERVFVMVDEKTGLPTEKSVLQMIETDTIFGIVDNPVIVAKDGSKYVINVSGAPIHDGDGSILGDIILFRDISSKKRMEEEVVKSQKLESLGTLAAGIAYDFNNLLSSLFGYIEMAMVFHNSKEKVAQYLSRALGIYERATGLTDKLITFSRRGLPEKKTTSLVELLEESAQFALSGSKIRYSMELPDNLWLCDIDRIQIQQVFSNILINSMQAMPDGGVIEIKGENVPGSNAPEWTGKTSNYVKVTIIDEGTGIPESYLDRIFDPFFTTKQQGSGLGLATAYSILNKHKGNIDVVSKPGQGTTVNVFLPASQSAIHDDDSIEDAPVVYDSKILIMDDDPIIVDTVKDGLEELGYTIMVCANGSKALLIYEEEYLKGEPFDLLIFDLTVPGELGGLETLQILKDKYPDILAIATSGYLDNPVMSNPKKFGFFDKVEKPYSVDELVNVVHDALNDLK